MKTWICRRWRYNVYRRGQRKYIGEPVVVEAQCRTEAVNRARKLLPRVHGYISAAVLRGIEDQLARKA